MEWDKSLETGVELIDTQHKELFARVNDLLNASMQQRGKEKIGETLKFLEQYVVEHFRDEEQLQTSSSYPNAISHKMQHDAYVRTLKNLSNQYMAEGRTLNMVLAVNRNVVEWLINHISTHDKEFAQYYRNRQKS